MTSRAILRIMRTCRSRRFLRSADMTGRKSEAMTYRQLAQDMANRWVQMAQEGDHYKLAFDQPGTWSQKYNLVWDDILDLHLFPVPVAETEWHFYPKQFKTYGLPLDNRKTITKLDWEFWTASLTRDPQQFSDLAYRIV